MLQIDDVNDVLLEEILLQLDGEICGILRRIADRSVAKNENAASIQVLAMEARTAALASRLVCRRWRALGDHALATTLIRLRLLARQVKAAMYTKFLVQRMPASAHQLQRSGRPDATAAQLASSQEESMVAAYENCYSPVVITSADAAVELIRHLRKHNVNTPFVVFAAPKKLAAWQRYLQKKFTGRVSIFASQADFVDVDWRLQEGAIVSYAAAAYWPKRLVRLSYVILDDVRTYMWRPTFTHLFDRKGNIFQKNHASSSVEYALLDDFHAPCSLFELFNLMYYAANLPPHERKKHKNPLELQAYVMEVFDAFEFSPGVIDRLLRSQLEAATRHMMMS